jgi:hypothetical protein
MSGASGAPDGLIDEILKGARRLGLISARRLGLISARR